MFAVDQLIYPYLCLRSLTEIIICLNSGLPFRQKIRLLHPRHLQTRKSHDAWQQDSVFNGTILRYLLVVGGGIL